ncbi:MAG: hypothetical protein NTU88_16980, partial [Armatimonadetes bacterium]|nr:hypothetical protein [Armatimonadota bacterium]
MSRLRFLPAIAAVVLISRASAFAAGAEDVQFWTADSLTNVLQSAKPTPNARAEVVLEAARDEWEHGQIVVRSERPIANLRASIGDLRCPGGKKIPASECRCRFVAYILVEKNTQFTPPEE